MTATCSRSASTTGRSSSWSSGCRGRCRSGPSRSCTLRVPKLFNLRTDPFERADVTSNTYWDWLLDNASWCWRRTAIVTQFLATFVEFPPRQKAASFTIDQAVAKLESVLTAGQ